MRPPDHEGWLVPSAERGGPLRVRVWEAPTEPAAEEEWHAHLYVEGLEGYDPPRAIVGGSPVQATTLAFAQLHRLARERAGYVASDLHFDADGHFLG